MAKLTIESLRTPPCGDPPDSCGAVPISRQNNLQKNWGGPTDGSPYRRTVKETETALHFHPVRCGQMRLVGKCPLEKRPDGLLREFVSLALANVLGNEQLLS
ncbi:MAG: hypothetical protein ABH867_00685 [Patescibacteria group bacterium]